MTGDQALAREELDFMTYDHPIAQGALSLVIEGDTGRVSAGVWPELPRETPVTHRTTVRSAGDRAGTSRGRERSALAVLQNLSDSGRGSHFCLPRARRRRAATDTAESDRGDDGGAPRALPIAMEKAKDQVERDAATLIREALLTRKQKRLEEEHQRLVQLARVNKLITKREIDEHLRKSAKGRRL